MSRKVKEMIGGCCVCSDERGWSENPLVYCDGAGCNVAVHQACYGIVRVPTGPWFCRKCESQERVARVKCELCPQRAGALKRTDTGGWCHVVCALYIPEACFANVQTMEPIVLNAVPHERFNKTCYICEEQKRDTKATAGACMQCNKTNCKHYFHVTCAQAQGLLCEVMGSHGNVTYCGYCSQHYKKWKHYPNVKTIPAFQPIPSENGTSDSSPEKSNPKLEMDAKIPNKMSSLSLVTEKERSPQIDQSVSSTSDPVPLSVNCNSGRGALQGKSESQVALVSSAISPTGGTGDAAKYGSDVNGGSDHSSHEPSSSGAALASAGKETKITDVLIEKVADSSSTEQLNVDIEEDDDEFNLSSMLPAPARPKRQRPKSQAKSSNVLNKKQKNKSKPESSSSRQDRLKKSIKKARRASGVGNESAKISPHPQTSASSSLHGNHDFMGNTFGGSPFFQSLSAPGRVSMPSFSTNGTSFSSNGASHLVPPPKMFPSFNLPGSSQGSQNHTKDMPLSMEQLLEYQWEQGAQFLMQQGEHFDISSLLNTLHKIKADNQALEDHVKELSSRRDRLMLVNARLSVPLNINDARSEEEDDHPPLPVPGPAGDCPGTGVPRGSKNSSFGGSLEDISSPDDVQTPKLTPVQIPSHSTLVVEDIVSPVDSEHKSLLPILKPETEETRPATSFSYTDQMGVSQQQPLMYSAVNPPPPSLLPAMTTKMSPVLSPPPPALTPATSSVPSTTSSSSSNSTSSSIKSSSSSSSPLLSLPPPLLDKSNMPSLSSLSLGTHSDKPA